MVTKNQKMVVKICAMWNLDTRTSDVEGVLTSRHSLTHSDREGQLMRSGVLLGLAVQQVAFLLPPDAEDGALGEISARDVTDAGIDWNSRTVNNYNNWIYSFHDETKRTLSSGIFSAKNVTHQHGFKPRTSCLPGTRTTNCAMVTRIY